MCSMAEASSPGGLMPDQDFSHSIPSTIMPSNAPSLVTSNVHAHAQVRSKHPRSTCPLPPQTDIVVVGNGPAGILISLLLNGYEPYYHAEPSMPHPDPILHSMLAPTALEGCRPKSMLKQDFAQLTNHIQHQLAEAGRDANPISAMFDSLAHPHLDTHRGEYPSFLYWKHPPTGHGLAKQSIAASASDSQSPPPTPSFEHSTVHPNVSPTTTTARPHLVLGRSAVGGIWADMEQDHNQTLSYNEHMELPLYPFAEFLSEHAGYLDQQELDRPLRSAVSAYYKAYVRRMEIQSNFSEFTTVTSVYHLKDLPGHCCCALDPKLDSKQRHQMEEEVQQRMRLGLGPCKECSPFRYAVLGHINTPPSPASMATIVPTTTTKRRSKFLVRSKTVVLATGTFDQPKKLQAVSLHPCLPLPSTDPSALMIKQTFHDTRQLEEWMKRHGPNGTKIVTATTSAGSNAVSPPPSPSPPADSTPAVRKEDADSAGSNAVSPPPSPSPPADSTPAVRKEDADSPLPSQNVSVAPLQTQTPPPSSLPPPRPIVIVGTGLSAADAILLIQEKQPWRRVIHIYKHFTASEPSPLKRCHRDVYPGYASVWLQMRKCATLKNSVQMYQKQKAVDSGSTTKGQDGQQDGQQPHKPPCCQIFGDVSSTATQCEQCKVLQQVETGDDEKLENGPLALCSGCSYRGLPDASISSWDPITGEVVILLSHGVVIEEKVAAVGVFIGKEVHMGFLKGSLAEEMLSSPLEDGEFPGSSSSSPAAGYLSPPLPQAVATNPFDIKADLRRRLSRSGSSWRGRRPRRGSADSSRELAVNMLTPPCTPPRSPVLRPRKQSFWSRPCQLLQGALENRMMDLEADALPSSQKRDAEAGVDPTETCCCIDQGMHKDVAQEEKQEEEEESEESSPESEEEKVEEYQVLTLLRPLVSDMYNFRIIPSSTASSESGSLVDTVASASPALISLGSAGAYPTKAKKCTRLPCYPVRSSDFTTASAATTKASESTDSGASGSTLVGEDASGENESRDSPPRESSNRVTATKAISKSACLSMPCSPLLRSSQTVCPTLATPPLLTLCSAAAASALTNCLQSLTKTCRTSVSKIKDSDRTIEQDEGDEREGSGELLSTSASSTGTLSRSASVRSNRSTSVSSCTSSVCTLALNGSESATTTIEAEHERDQLKAVEVEEEHQPRHHRRLHSLVAPSCTPSLYPRLDQSIYAAGAITGSKFVRYVLGNGIAIVADILRHEEMEASL